MKKLIVLMFAAAVLFASGCGGSNDGDSLTGKWRGNITERGKSTLVELQLLENETGIEGALTILTETGQDAGKGMSFPVVQARRSGNALKFILAMFDGKVDDDAIAFELVVKGKKLDGHGHELRKGSDKLPITFTRQE